MRQSARLGQEHASHVAQSAKRLCNVPLAFHDKQRDGRIAARLKQRHAVDPVFTIRWDML
jgi:hypothetical protein